MVTAVVCVPHNACTVAGGGGRGMLNRKQKKEFHELWCRPAAAAPIQPLSRELSYAVGAALKIKTNKTKKKRNEPSSHAKT